MTLIEAINKYAKEKAELGDWEGVAIILNNTTVEVRDSTPVTYARIRELFGEQLRAQIAAMVRNVANSNSLFAGEMADVHSVMLNEDIGFRLDLPERQEFLKQLGWDSELVEQISALGVRDVKVVGDVTTEECQSAYVAEQARLALQTLQTRRREWDTLSAQIRSQIESGQLADNAAVIAAVTAGLEV